MTSDKEKGLARRVAELQTQLRVRDKRSLANRTGASYDDAFFLLPVWSRHIRVNADSFVATEISTGNPCDPLTQAMIAYYFYTSDGAPLEDEWITFRDLPDGQFYATAFQGYSGDRVANQFGNDLEAFKLAALRIGGDLLPLGDACFRFQALPRVPVAIIAWMGDEEFPPSYRILFDKSIAHHLPTDACAILGSMLTTKFEKGIKLEAQNNQGEEHK